MRARIISSMNKKDGPDGLAVMHRNAGNIYDIAIKEKLKQLAIHPDNEWMVASTISSFHAFEIYRSTGIQNRSRSK